MTAPELELSEPADLTALVKEAANRAFGSATRDVTYGSGSRARRFLAAMNGPALAGAVSELTACSVASRRPSS